MYFFITMKSTNFIFFYYFSTLFLERELILSFFSKTLTNIFNENYLEPIPYT